MQNTIAMPNTGQYCGMIAKMPGTPPTPMLEAPTLKIEMNAPAMPAHAIEIRNGYL